MPVLVAREKQTTDLAESEYHWLKESLHIAGESTDHEVVVDLAAIETIRSDEFCDLIRLRSKLQNAGRTLTLENVQQQVWEIFKLTRLNRVIEMRPLVHDCRTQADN